MRRMTSWLALPLACHCSCGYHGMSWKGQPSWSTLIHRFSCIHWGFCLTSWVRQCKLTVRNLHTFGIIHMAMTLHLPHATSQLPVPLTPELLLAIHPDKGPIILDIAPRLAAWTG